MWGGLEMAWGNGGKHGGDDLQGGEGHTRVGETGGKHGGDNFKCGGNMGEIICKVGKDIQEWGKLGGKHGRDNLKCGGKSGETWKR
jgi:hypothetical protein